ncbi:MAG TPA: DUF1178 family protein [Stellaceae bacterium]|jgi:hypothetical protein|nr:DUF1178 family protein [Stellaceae bacterium]
MIVFTLRCKDGHEFETWFRDGATYERQSRRGLVTCPDCGSTEVEKAIMAPRLGRSTKSDPAPRLSRPEAAPEGEAAPAVPQTAPSEPERPPTQAEFRRALQVLRGYVETNCENVGKGFADEARRIHKGEAKARGIYGDATPAEAEKLADEGIEVAAIPWVPTNDA